MANQADETIITRFIAESAEAIKDAQQYRNEINTVKKQLKELAAESKLGFKDMGEGMIRTFNKAHQSPQPDS